MTIPQAAIDAAAEAMHEAGWTCEAHEPLGLDNCDRCADSTPKAVQKILTAALPHLREQIAQEIEAAPRNSTLVESGLMYLGMDAAARIVRGEP